MNILVVAQTGDSVAVNRKLSFSKNQLCSSGILLTGGIFAETITKRPATNIVEEERKHLFGFTNDVDDYAQYAPYVSVFGFKAFGIPSRSDAVNQLAIAIKSDALALASVYILKVATQKPRPDGTAYSFPSGHTANAFAGATMLSIEYKDEIPWIPYAAYGIASGVGAMRIANKKHYFSDVLVGAGLGILSTKVVYWTHQYRWKAKSKVRENKLQGILY